MEQYPYAAVFGHLKLDLLYYTYGFFITTMAERLQHAGIYNPAAMINIRFYHNHAFYPFSQCGFGVAQLIVNKLRQCFWSAFILGAV